MIKFKVFGNEDEIKVKEYANKNRKYGYYFLFSVSTRATVLSLSRALSLAPDKTQKYSQTSRN